MTGVVNNTGARSGAVGTTVGTPSGGLDGVTTGSGDVTISDGDLIFLDTGCTLAWTMQAFEFKKNQRLFHDFKTMIMK